MGEDFLEDYEQQSISRKIKTYVSFNKGGEWSLVSAPSSDSKGAPISCRQEHGCSLHFHSVSTQNNIAPLYSFESAPGLIIANGNVGPHLDSREPAMNTYLSRDGGKNWFEIAKGSHVYEFGNNGALIVMAPDMNPTKHVLYSWDEGLTWDFETISNEDVVV